MMGRERRNKEKGMAKIWKGKRESRPSYRSCNTQDPKGREKGRILLEEHYRF